MIAQLVAKSSVGSVRAPIALADATRLPFARAFDAALLSHVLHLVPALEPVADALRPVLRAGARLVVVDSAYLPRAAGDRVIAAMKAHLGATRRWASGERSRELALLERFGGLLGAGEVEIVPCGEFAATRSLRQHLEAARRRVWSMWRTFDEGAVRSAADAAERDLVSAGADLDAAVAEPVGVRLLIARLPG